MIDPTNKTKPNYNRKTSIPRATVVVYNYDKKLGLDDTLESEATSIGEIIIPHTSITNIRTFKAKKDPVGSFELHLVPSKRWETIFRLGSWIVIHMAANADIDTKNAKYQSVKLIGFVNSVRVTVSVNPKNGAKTRKYIVTGYDWGYVFNDRLYLDRAIDMGISEQVNPYAAGALLKNSVGAYSGTQAAKARNGLFAEMTTVRNTIGVVLKFWGKSTTIDKDLDAEMQEDILFKKDNKTGKAQNKMIYHAQKTFEIPTQLLKFMRKKQKNVSISNLDNLNLITGALKERKDTYKQVNEATVLLNPYDVYGQRSVWEILSSINAAEINEMFCDLRWEGKDPSFGLYNRIKPFLIRKDFGKELDFKEGKDDQNLEDYKSYYWLIKSHKISLDDIRSLDAGNNWENRINFIEIQHNEFSDAMGPNMIKNFGQDFDEQSFRRDGFRPMIVPCKSYPADIVELFSENNLADITSYEATIERTKQKLQEESLTSETLKDILANTSKGTSSKSTIPEIPKVNQATDITQTLTKEQLDEATRKAVIQPKSNEIPDRSFAFYERLSIIKKLQREWFFNLYKMLDGRITIMGQDRYIAVGENIRFPASALNDLYPEWAYILAHVESVSHTFGISESNGSIDFYTTIEFSRGILETEVNPKTETSSKGIKSKGKKARPSINPDLEDICEGYCLNPLTEGKILSGAGQEEETDVD